MNVSLFEMQHFLFTIHRRMLTRDHLHVAHLVNFAVDRV
jgi:hypothetical protein